METGVCIYCGRTLELPALLEKGGRYRCKDEDDCLDYQTRINSPDSPEEPEDMAGLIKTFLSEAAQRIAACRTAGAPAGDAGETAEEETAARTWMTAAFAALAAEYREKTEFQFHAGENGAYAISFHAADRAGSFTVGLAPLARSRYALTVAAADAAAAGEMLYGEFIYKSYPGSRREEALQDLSVLLLAFAEEEHRSALLRQFRMELEARCYAGGDL
jgi:hypothetical protein